MKLTFEGKVRQYHPASGLDLIPGTHDYPDDAAADLASAGLKDPKEIEKKQARAALKALKEIANGEK